MERLKFGVKVEKIAMIFHGYYAQIDMLTPLKD